MAVASINGDDFDIIEGLICPVCVQDFPSILQLQAHFEEEHEALDRDVIQSLKDLFNKAKKIIRKDEEVFDTKISPKLLSAFPTATANENNEWEWELPKGLCSRSHGQHFKKIRSARIDSFTAETNKLLIRLDKLLTNMPTDHVKRKAHEKSIVPWANDKDVPLCPSCAKGFNIGRRRHHCRLCGAIMCDDCSQFLSPDVADKLASIVHVQNHNIHPHGHHSTAEGEKSSGSFGALLGGFTSLKRSGSHGSLNSILSMVDSISKEMGLRVCSHCLHCLHTRLRQKNQKTTKPLLLILYSRLMESKRQMADLIPQFLDMCSSLNAGESTFDLKEAEELRVKIFKLSDLMSMTAQKIRDLGQIGVTLDEDSDPPAEDGNPTPAGHRQELLQKRIHSSSLTFLRDSVLSLPKMLTKEEFAAKKERRRQDAEARLISEREASIYAEKRAAIIMKKNKADYSSPKGTPKPSSSSITPPISGLSTPRRRVNEEVMTDTGWCADTSAHNVTETDDPIVQQMNIIRNCIYQAKLANRGEEVSILEDNLKELRLEYKKQKTTWHL